ncbi:Rne/Rng family ribonuclease [Bacillus kexueae]|uniref:Rne/Rng family ribonuclease n=1 Tax=Aeribacillus kexueae TaxID=2078952 RepID=UPI001FAED2C3|nr:Rne/Rng family ribonuclease [Bacillus kexueae]
MRQLIVNARTEEEKIALLENGRLTEMFIKDRHQKMSPGSIYKGRVRNIVPGLQAAFVDIGEEINGYLHRNDVLAYLQAVKNDPSIEAKSISSFLREGEEIIVQLVKEGSEHKAPKLTMNLEFKTSSLVYKPFEEHVAISKKIIDEDERSRLEQFGRGVLTRGGLIIRTDAQQHSTDTLRNMFADLEHASTAVLKKKGATPCKLYHPENFIEEILHEISLHSIDEIIYDRAHIGKIVKQLMPKNAAVQLTFHSGTEDVFSLNNVDEEIDKALRKNVWLKNGGFIVIEETEAMTVIDVNTGKFSGKHTYRDTVLQTNKEAAIEIVKQLRLRNLSGMIVIDFIDMKEKRDQDTILQVIRNELKEDRVYSKVIGFTELNLLQITRKKVRKSLSELVTSSCSSCNGTGRVLSNESIAFRLQRELLSYRTKDVEAVLVEVRPDVIPYIEEGSLLEILESHLHMKLFIVPNHYVRTYAIRMEGSLVDIQKRMGRT